MNPFTQSLINQLHDQQLAEFVADWDTLEALVIRVYKGEVASVQDEEEHRRLRKRLQKWYPRWQGALQIYWPQTKSAGEFVKEDPFASLLRVEHAGGFVGNWKAMQTFPAAREALNQFLMDQIRKLNL